MAKELFRPKFSPKGMSYSEARKAGTLIESETWWLRFRHQGKTIRESTNTKKYSEAKTVLAKRKEGLARGEPVVKDANKVTFNDMATRLRDDYDINGKHRPTLDARLAQLTPVFGSRRLADIRADDVASYVKQRNAGGASNGSINRDLEILARAFALGRKLGLITATLRVRDHRLAEAAPRSGFFERSQFDAVLAKLAGDDLRLACEIAHTYGWRMQSEILTLERRQINLDAAEGMGTITLDPGSTKNDDARSVVLTPALRAAIADQLQRLDTFQHTCGVITPYLFVHTKGRLRGTRIKDFARAWRTACKKAGVAGRLRHDLRRTAVRGLVNAGVPERVSMEITGHRTRSVFDRYHIVSQSDHVRAAQLLAASQADQVNRDANTKGSL